MTADTMSDVPRPRLPDIALPPAGGGAPVPVRAHRRGTVLVLVASAADEGLDAYLAALAAHDGALRDWDGRVLVVIVEGVAPPATGFPVLADARGRLAEAAGVVVPAVVVADQWGEVHAAEPAAGGRWLASAEVEQWLRMIAIRCAG